MLQTFRKQTVILTLLSFALSAIPALQADSPAPRPGQVKFEVRFLTDMIEHHNMAVMIRHHEKAIREGMHCVDHAYHKGLIELCESMVQTQTEEILLMEQWLCEWYDRCN